MDSQNKNELDFIKAYEKKGFTNSYRINGNKLIENGSNHEFNPKDITVVAKHRYEGQSNPDDMSILYVVETNKNTKGTILAAYGPSADNGMLEFFNQIPEENISQSKSILNS
jgi:hypothetical protein